MSAIDNIHWEGPAGRIEASFVRPRSSAPAPAILLLQEGIGVTTHLLDVARLLAGLGYFVLVPDLYCRDAVRQTLTDDEVLKALPLARNPNREALLAALPADERASAGRVVTWFASRDTRTYLPDALAALSYLQSQREVRPDAIGSLGFSLGGVLTAQLAAAGAGLAAAVIFYGAPPDTSHLGDVRCPLQGHYAEKDPAITPRVPAFVEALRRAGKSLTPFVYQRTEHGFFNDLRPVYDAGAAQLSFDRTQTFFARHLSRPGYASALDVPAFA
jgi:carboxymethylenebutenolidase